MTASVPSGQGQAEGAAAAEVERLTRERDEARSEVEWRKRQRDRAVYAYRGARLNRISAERRAAAAESRAEAAKRRAEAAEGELVLLDEVCAIYTLDEARFLRDDDEPFGSVPIAAGMKARQAGRRYAEREAAELDQQDREAHAVIADSNATEDDRHFAALALECAGYARDRLAPLLAAQIAPRDAPVSRPERLASEDARAETTRLPEQPSQGFGHQSRGDGEPIAHPVQSKTDADRTVAECALVAPRIALGTADPTRKPSLQVADHTHPHTGDIWRQDPETGRIVETVRADPVPPTAREIRAAALEAGEDREREYHDGVVIAEAMQAAWDDFVADTGCYPDCFSIRRGKLFADFKVSNFARMVAAELRA